MYSVPGGHTVEGAAEVASSSTFEKLPCGPRVRVSPGISDDNEEGFIASNKPCRNEASSCVSLTVELPPAASEIPSSC